MAAVRRGIVDARLVAFGWLAALAVLVLLLIVALTAGPSGSDALENSDEVVVDEDPHPLAVLSLASRQLSERVGQSVVRVEVERSGRSADDELRQLFGDDGIVQQAQGSGVVVASDPLVLTNYHVVSGADQIWVVRGEQRHPATVVGDDALTDLALLQIDGVSDWTAATWSDSGQVAVGDLVWAVGNPYGLQRSVTFGIVSAIQQDQVASTPYQNFLQTDAAVNPGGSGGPIVNVDGHVIGINTAILGKSFRGISFAVASNTARNVVEQLQASGRVQRGWIGVRLGEARGAEPGALVVALSGAAADATPAHSAGIRPGDRIVRWGEVPIRDAVQLARLVAQSDIGTRVRLQLVRQGETVEVELVVAERE